MVGINPWLTSKNTDSDQVGAEQNTPEEPPIRASSPPGPTTPQEGVGSLGDELPKRQVNAFARWWWVGVHGGAGESTLASVSSGTRVADHAWPQVATAGVNPVVVLVARTHARGLLAAQAAAAHWAAGTSGVDLLGLVLIADAPGRLPRPLKDLSALVAGGVPRVWRLPWHEPWRLGEVPSPESSPKAVRAMVAELDRLVP